MDTKARSEEIIEKASKRFVKDVGDGFCFDMDLLKKEIEYHLLQFGEECAEERERDMNHTSRAVHDCKKGAEQARKEGAEAMRERAAKVCEQLGAEWLALDEIEYREAANELAKEIRALDL